MTFKVPKLRRVLRKIGDWASLRLGLPTSDWVTRKHSDWEYQRVDSQASWKVEEHSEPLRAAMNLRKTDPARAFASLLALAEAGSVIAMNIVGECYRWSLLGVTEDRPRAEHWFEKAFAGGSQRALLNYGRLLFWRGDPGAAEAVFRVGAVDDWAPAHYWLARTLLGQPTSARTRTEARLLLQRAAAQGHPAARRLLGREMAWGRFGLKWVPTGFTLLSRYSEDILSSWAAQNETVLRTTPDGDTLH